MPSGDQTRSLWDAADERHASHRAGVSVSVRGQIRKKMRKTNKRRESEEREREQNSSGGEADESAVGFGLRGRVVGGLVDRCCNICCLLRWVCDKLLMNTSLVRSAQAWTRSNYSY